MFGAEQGFGANCAWTVGTVTSEESEHSLLAFDDICLQMLELGPVKASVCAYKCITDIAFRSFDCLFFTLNPNSQDPETLETLGPATFPGLSREKWLAHTRYDAARGRPLTVGCGLLELLLVPTNEVWCMLQPPMSMTRMTSLAPSWCCLSNRDTWCCLNVWLCDLGSMNTMRQAN